MFKGDWRIYAAFGIGIALVSANIWAVIDYRGAYYSAETSRPENGEPDSAARIGKGCVSIGRGLRVGCVPPEDSAHWETGEAHNKPKDAESDSAAWSFGSMLADGWAALLTLTGVIFVILAFNQSRRDFIAANRPRISISRIQGRSLFYINKVGGDAFSCEMVLTNLGESVAYPVSLMFEMGVRKPGTELKHIKSIEIDVFDFMEIPPGAQGAIKLSSQIGPSLSDVHDRYSEFFLTGRFSYVDRNDVVRLTDFFRIYDRSTKTFQRPHVEDPYADNDREY